MSYDISWHRLPVKEDAEYEEPTYSEEEKAILSQHSNLCGELDYEYRTPFDHESTGLNITFNLCKMFSWAINGNPDKYWRDTIHGKKGKQITKKLQKAIRRMERYPRMAMKYEAENGWGTYSGALRFLKDLCAESVYWKDFYLNVGR